MVFLVCPKPLSSRLKRRSGSMPWPTNWKSEHRGTARCRSRTRSVSRTRRQCHITSSSENKPTTYPTGMLRSVSRTRRQFHIASRPAKDSTTNPSGMHPLDRCWWLNVLRNRKRSCSRSRSTSPRRWIAKGYRIGNYIVGADGPGQASFDSDSMSVNMPASGSSSCSRTRTRSRSRSLRTDLTIWWLALESETRASATTPQPSPIQGESSITSRSNATEHNFASHCYRSCVSRC